MRIIIICAYIFFNTLSLASQQVEFRIDSLLSEAKGISEHIDQLNIELDSINEIVKLLKFEEQQKEEAKLDIKGIKTVTLSEVKLRKGPSAFDTVITTIPAKAYISIHGIESNYYKARYDGKFGYVFRDYIKDVSELKELKLKRKNPTSYSSKITSTSSSSKSKKNYKSKNKSGTWVKGHYRKQNGKKVWVRGHYRKY